MARNSALRVSLTVAVVVGTVALVSSSLYAGEGVVKKNDSTKGCVTVASPVVKTGGIKLEASENSEPWIDLGAIIEDVKGGIKVTQAIPLPKDFPVVASLEVGTLIKTFQDKPVTTAADLIAQYDKLKAGSSLPSRNAPATS
jgi:hypothetical protein